MTKIHVCFAVRDNCYNPWETSGGMRCVACHCCVKDIKIRTKARAGLYQRLLDEAMNFDRWDEEPELKAIQKKNNAINIAWAKKRLAYYNRRLTQMEEEE